VQHDLLEQEAEVKELGKFMAGLAKEMKAFTAGLALSVQSANALAKKMKSAKYLTRRSITSEWFREEGEQGLAKLEPVMIRAADMLSEMAGAQEILIVALEAGFIKPVDAFVTVEVPKVEVLRRNSTAAEALYETALGRYLRPSGGAPHVHTPAAPAVSPGPSGAGAGAGAGGANAAPGGGRKGLFGLLGRAAAGAGVGSGGGGGGGGGEGGGYSDAAGERERAREDKRASNLAEAVRESELARFNLCYKLFELEARKTFELGECIVACVYSFRSYFHHIVDAVENLGPAMDDLQAMAIHMRDRFQAGKVPWEVRRQRLNEVLYTLPAEQPRVEPGNELRLSSSCPPASPCACDHPLGWQRRRD